MFKRILVSVDGSYFSERALEPAFELARRFDAEVILLRVVALETIAMASGNGPQVLELNDMHEKYDREAAESYLRGIKAHWQTTGVPIGTRVALGAAPEMILEVAGAAGADLIVMSTHGRSGLDRFLYGSVAEAVLRGTRLPLMLIPIKKSAD
jgi:nucleotide-binding universal stress UspA family protein